MFRLLGVIIKGYLFWFKYYLNKSYREKRKVEAQKRIQICENCEFFWKFARNCMICGCFMDVKTKMPFELDENGLSIEGCPEKKW